MMSRHFGLSSELTGAIAKILPHAKNQLSAPGSFFNQFVTDIYIYIYIHIHNNRVLIVRIYSRLSLTRTPRDRGDLYSLSGVRINRSTYIVTFVQNT